MKIPFLDLHASYIELQNEIDFSISEKQEKNEIFATTSIKSFGTRER